MFETKRDALGYTLNDLAILRDALTRQNNGVLPNPFPLFPDSAEFEKRREIYKILSQFPRIKQSIHDTMFQFAKSSNTTPGLKSKVHYENDPDGIRKQEIWELLVKLKEHYYDAIRHTENLIAYTGRSNKKINQLFASSDNASKVFESSFQTLTTKWNTGAYGENPEVKSPVKKRRKKGEIQDVLAILARHDIRITARTLQRWLKNPPKDFPGIEDKISLNMWASEYDRNERMSFSLKNNYSEEEIYKNRRK